MVRVWDVEGWREVYTLSGHTSLVTCLAFGEDGCTLASGSYDDTVRVWDTRSGEAVRVIKGHTGTVYALTFSLDGLTLISGSMDHEIRVWDIATGAEVSVLKAVWDKASDCWFNGHQGGVRGVGALQGGRVVS
eukprot:Hpha_TRINITY_DN16567_c0_g1::TRINITY_DN16567_c0_g1_i5::g.136486::m.136486